MVKEKSVKSDKKREAPASNEDGGDVEMANAVPEPSPKKAKKEREETVILLEDLSPLAHPLAQKKLVKKLHKIIKKASKARQVKRGVKEVVKGIRKGEKGLLVLAGDINPIDIISHLPVLSEEAQIPYIFVASKEELGHASSTKRPTSCVMVCPNQKRKTKRKEGEEEDKDEDYRELYDECFQEVERLNTKIVF
jgi:H/ACA ribonucleoprotein complex subunit 2